MIRPHWLRTRFCFVLGLMLLPGLFVAARQSPDAAPLRPGALALMGGQPDPSTEIRRGLQDPEPLVRSVAARLAGVRGVAATVDDVTRALETERDPDAEVEEVRALLFLRGESSVEALLARTYRGYRPLVTIASWIAGTHPDDLSSRLPMLATRLGTRVGQLNASVLFVVGTRPDIAAATLRAWLAVATPAAWSSLVADRSFDPAVEGFAVIVAEALRSPIAPIRESTTWMLVNRVADGVKTPTVILDALSATAAQTAGAEVTWEAFGRELLARYQGTHTPDRSAFLTAEAGDHSQDAFGLAGVNQLTAAERKALRATLGERFPERPETKHAMPGIESSGTAGMRTLPVLWPGFLASLVAEAGCQVSPTPKFAAIHATYAEDGRVSHAQIDPGVLPAECVRVIAALARLIFAEPTQRPLGPTGEWVFVPMDASYLACTNEPSALDPEPPVKLTRSAGTIKAPTKIKHVTPEYPPEQMRQHLQGMVVIESTISTSGCPMALRVTRSVHPVMDAAALRAVTQWRFTPTELDGKPVPVVMTVSVNFTLR
jgi:TonB family protein